MTRSQATQRYWEPFRGSMRGRVMYVLPCELATGTPVAEAGVQITGRTIRAPGVAARDYLDAHVHALRLANTDVEAQRRLPARMAVVEVVSGDRSHFIGVVAPNRFGRAGVQRGSMR